MSYLAVPAEIEIFPEPLFGIVEQRIEARKLGKVKFLDISWQACFYGDFDETEVGCDRAIAIVGVVDATLLVVPISIFSE
ncbi:MAG: hypothetical protein SAJ37_08450 [Oscillatoria sp. PMC 1068.18]|nr:hypothetical protein [Oscillatoria sp. PMC 1076.18]MEC4988764.1 hypothetical protein [Oscillatoria sp. PMC 1068.18]